MKKHGSFTKTTTSSSRTSGNTCLLWSLPLLLWITCLPGCETKKKQTVPLETPTSHTPKPLFEKKTPEQTGVYFINTPEEDAYKNILLYQYFYNGGGVALGDVNNDGNTDIFLTGNTVSNKLYLNQGAFRFADATLTAGLGKTSNASWCTGATMVDINHDGWLDIYVCRSGNLQPDNRRNLLYVNRQDGTFREEAAAFGLDDPGYSVQAAFFDYDKDGDLDMFLINHGMEYYGQMQARASNTRDPYIGDKLFENKQGKYVDISAQAGILGSKEGYGLGVCIADLNQDGWEDIYVANDFYEHDYLYIHQGNQTGRPVFKESIHTATRQTSFFGMGVDMGDYNNDGWQDVVVLDMAAEDHERQKTNLAGISKNKFREFVSRGYHYQYMYNSLQLNNGTGPDGNPVFSNIARLAGMAQTDWSWFPLLADFDNDGWKDLLVTNGLRKDVMNNDFIAGLNDNLTASNTHFVDLTAPEAQQLLDQMPSQKIRNYVFQNQRDLTFQNKAQAWGLEDETFSNGAAYADLDHDGDLDIVINNIDDFAGIYENHASQSGSRFLRLKLKGNEANPLGFGAEVTLYKNDSLQFQQLYPTRGFQSSVEPVVHFGVGSSKTVDSIRVEWYDQKISVLKNVVTNQTRTIDYQQAMRPPDDRSAPGKKKLFREAAPAVGLNFTHRESVYDDFDREFLLPRQFSSEGPCLATGDVNGDGWDDLFVGGARGQAGQLFLQTGQGGFVKAPQQPWKADAGSEDVDALFFDADQDGDLDLYVASGSNEFSAGAEACQDRLYTNDGKGRFTKSKGHLPDLRANTACVAAADFDKDGDLDLFVGGGVAPGRYPLGAESFLLENKEGTFRDVTKEKAPALRQPGFLPGIQPGILSAVLWTDFNQDGWQDLIVAGEWMPLCFYKNEKGKLSQDTTSVKFFRDGKALLRQQTTGWWKCIVPIDVDEDGDQDYIVGNMGLNYRFHPTAEAPLEVFAGDFDANGANDALIGYDQNKKRYPIHGREDLTTQLPALKKKYPDYASFAKATLPEMIQSFSAAPSLHLQAAMFEHVILLNEGHGKFNIKPLPMQAQTSTLQDILVQDFDADGAEDALLAGNLYEIETKTPRDDAGVGLLLGGIPLKGPGGNMKPVPMRESGFYAPGNVRDLAFIKTPNGSLIIVANNNASLQVFQITN